jgi:FRG domain
MDVITSLAALQEAVNALPPVPPGKVRVFRGQTDNYKTISPSSYRNPIAFGGVWLNYSRSLLSDIEPDPAAGIPALQELQTQTLWLEAIAQHYGSGSWYLDVTHSIECAAWFALHRGTGTTENRHPKANGLAAGPETAEVKWLTYSRAVEPGYFYVFDVDSWDATKGNLPELALVDLSRAPEPFRTPRMLAQQGCLIRTGESEEYDLLKRKAIADPLRIGWPMTGSEIVNRSVGEMFPEPAVDDWYRRFLSVPMMPEAKSGPLSLQTPLPVTRYRGESEAYNAKLDEMDWFLDPPLVHDVLRKVEKDATDTEQGRLQKDMIAAATPIVIEASVFYILPKAESNLWNHELLVSDLSDSVKSWAEDGAEAGDVNLTNVLFQFSPLEQAFWERAGEQTRTLRRGLWLYRQGGNFIAAQVAQDFPGTELKVWPAAVIMFDKEKRRLVCRRATEAAEAPVEELTTVPVLAKAVFCGLHLLRSMAPQWKIEARPFQYCVPIPDDGTYESYFKIGMVDDVARLRRVHGPDGVPDWFVVRKKEWREAPFTTGGNVSRIQEIRRKEHYIDLTLKVHAHTGPAGS